jgi:hypothetical protein
MLGCHLLVLRCGGAEGLAGWLDACSRSTGVEIHGELEVGCRMLTMGWDECQMKGWTIANRRFQCD